MIYYARHVTPRRAVPVGLMALSELHRRRPELRIVLFGDEGRLESPFPYEHLGVLTPPQLATLYSEATVGLCLSLTNFSLMPKEMLACGLPCVELAGVSAESIFGSDGPLELAPLDPRAIADALERLLDDPEHREQRSREGIEFVASHTWEHATDEVEAGLRHALREREAAARNELNILMNDQPLTSQIERRTQRRAASSHIRYRARGAADRAGDARLPRRHRLVADAGRPHAGLRQRDCTLSTRSPMHDEIAERPLDGRVHRIQQLPAARPPDRRARRVRRRLQPGSRSSSRSNLVFVPLLAASCYRRRPTRRTGLAPGLLAAIFALGTPMIVSESHEAYVDPHAGGVRGRRAYGGSSPAERFERWEIAARSRVSPPVSR